MYCVLGQDTQLSQPANWWGILTNCGGVTCDGLVGVEMLPLHATETGKSSVSYEPVCCVSTSENNRDDPSENEIRSKHKHNANSSFLKMFSVHA